MYSEGRCGRIDDGVMTGAEAKLDRRGVKGGRNGTKQNRIE